MLLLQPRKRSDLIRVHLKKLDLFVLKSFGIMFIGTFFICLFIFVMQFLWLYVDEMVGKGLSLDVLGQFFYLATLTLVPRSLPLAILLAALMTFGNFGERVELTAMKAAGIPLLRVMRPLIIFCVPLCLASFYFQNVIIPDSQLKLNTLLVSMKQKSPELEIPEGAFYDGIEGYNLFVDHKNRDTGVLYGVVIYNFTDGFENAHIIKADSGRLETTADKNFLKMTLYDGEQFENFKTDNINRKNIPYRREVFGRKTILIAFNDEFNVMDAGFLSANASSKNMRQLINDRDSLTQEQDSIGRAYFNTLKRGTYSVYTITGQDSTRMAEQHVARLNMDSVYFSATRDQQLRWRTSEKSKIENMRSETMLKKRSVYLADKNIRKHRIEWWNKIVLSLACMVFFFIGAPLGAIIRRGGLGVSILVSVLIFIIYYILDSNGAKLSREGEMTVWFGRWLSTIVLAPMGAFFTIKANRDSTVFNADAYKAAFRWMVAKPEERHVSGKEVIIHDPDYAACSLQMNGLDAACGEWRTRHDWRRPPHYVRFFRGTHRDEVLESVVESMESLVATLGNSRDAFVIGKVSDYPIFNARDHVCPLPEGWLSVVAALLVPVGGLLWLRAWFFTRRRTKNLERIVRTNAELQQIFIDRQLVNNKV